MIARGELRLSAVMLSVLSVSVVAAVVYFDVHATSPGELSAAHGRHPLLAGPAGCVKCHPGNGRPLREACLACHADIGGQVKLRRGFHGAMPASRAQDCASCHTEHHGKQFPITNRRSFEFAGVTSASEFTHPGVEFHLTGKHDRLKCNACHPAAFQKTLAPGQKRYLGLSQQCTACHEDVHHGTFGGDCNSCHGQVHAFDRVAEFEHTAAFPLENAHADPKCVDCHQGDSSQSVDRLLQQRKANAPVTAFIRDCSVCHDSPHRPSFLAAVARDAGTEPSKTCAQCHSNAHGGFLAPRTKLTANQHACTGFPLTAPHDEVTCSQCHFAIGQPKPDEASWNRAFPGRRADDCMACHRDPHGGQFELANGIPMSCLSCHDAHRWLPSTFTRERHGMTSFPLLGAHQSTTCDGCHLEQHLEGTGSAQQASPVRQFRNTPSSCASCHADIHDGQFASASDGTTNCRRCHDERSFQHPTFDVADHNLTSFPLTGAHAAVACASCHLLKEPSRTWKALPRSDLAATGDTVRRFAGTPAKCSACHEDVHRGRFNRQGLPATIDGKTDCARCHTTSSFREIRARRFDHGRWTGYPLQGAHMRLRCSDCHDATRVANENSSRMRLERPAKSRKCHDCHGDPHLGQFGNRKTVDCRRCHAEGESFRELVFDHQLHSRFRLDDNHRQLACAACHRQYRLPDGTAVTRYKPLGTKCGDCHQPLGRGGGRGGSRR